MGRYWRPGSWSEVGSVMAALAMALYQPGPLPQRCRPWLLKRKRPLFSLAALC